MKKALIILLILSFCGGSNESTQNEPTSNQVAEKTNQESSQVDESSSLSPDESSTLDNFIICMQKDGLDFYHDNYDSAGDPTFIYYEKDDLDPVSILTEDCFMEAENLGLQGSTGVEGLVDQLIGLFYVMEDVGLESQEDTECNTIITSDGSCVDALTFNIYNFVACMQTEGLDFYQAYLNELGEPRFYYYEKQDIDGLLILKEACLFDAKNLGNINPNGNDSFFNYVVMLLTQDSVYAFSNLTSLQSSTTSAVDGRISKDIDTGSYYRYDGDSGSWDFLFEITDITTEIDSTNETDSQTEGKKTCNEYGCFLVFTEIENWTDGVYEDGGVSPSTYTGYENTPVINDNVVFDNLNAIEKSSRSSAASVVNVFGDRCFFDGDVLTGTFLATQPYTGFFIDKNHIVTTRKVSENLEFQENNNSESFGSLDGGQSNKPCKDLPELYLGPGVTSITSTYQGEGVFVQLFDGNWGLGKIVHTDQYLAIIEIEKFTDNFDSLTDTWNDWSVYRNNIKPLPVLDGITIKDQEVVLIHNPSEGSFGGGWKTTISNLKNCPENTSGSNNYYLDIYSDRGSLGAPVVDEFGNVLGVAIGDPSAYANTCSIVKSSSNRNSLGSLSSYLADNLQITNVLNSSQVSKTIKEYSSNSGNLNLPANSEITDLSWPKNAITVSEKRVERIEWGNDFTNSGFPKSELSSSAIDTAKQGTLMFVRQVGCADCEDKAKDLDFAGGCLCTAFAVTNDLIVTNDHCVSSMSVGDRATFKTYFGQVVDAQLIGMSSIDGDGSHNDLYREITGFDGEYDSGHKGDVALFRSTQVLELTPLVLADSSNLNQYDPLIAVGHPGIMSRTGPYVVSVGSFIGKNTWADSDIYYNLPSAGGNSGSGVFNLNGEVIGQIANGQAFSMAEVASIVYSKYGKSAVEVSNSGVRGPSIRPQPWNLTSKVDVTVGYASSGAPSNYIKELIELWAPGELGY